MAENNPKRPKLEKKEPDQLKQELRDSIFFNQEFVDYVEILAKKCKQHREIKRLFQVRIPYKHFFTEKMDCEKMEVVESTIENIEFLSMKTKKEVISKINRLLKDPYGFMQLRANFDRQFNLGVTTLWWTTDDEWGDFLQRYHVYNLYLSEGH